MESAMGYYGLEDMDHGGPVHKRTNYNRLIKNQDEFDNLPGLNNSAVSEALNAISEEEKAQTTEQLKTLLRMTQACKERNIEAIRNARKAEKAAKERLSEIDRAIQFGAIEENWQPLIWLIHFERAIPIEQRKVPKDWSPHE